MTRSKIGALLLALGAVVVTAAPAAAAKPTPASELVCDNGFVGMATGDAGEGLHLIDAEWRRFIIHRASRVDPDTGELILLVDHSSGKHNEVTCEWVGPTSGTQFVFEGFFAGRP